MSGADAETLLAGRPRGGQSAATTGATSPDADPARLHHLIVLSHPGPGSFNHAVARAYADRVSACGQTPVMRDLYALGFDPVLRSDERAGAPGFRLSPDVESELELVRQASAIVMVYPIWFGMPPAMITGYVDRVLGAGFDANSMRSGERHDTVSDKQFVLLTSSGSTKPWLAERGQWQGLREAFDFYLESLFSFADCQHEHFDAIVSPLSPSYAAHCFERAANLAKQTCATVLSAAHARRKDARIGSPRSGAGLIEGGSA